MRGLNNLKEPNAKTWRSLKKMPLIYCLVLIGTLLPVARVNATSSYDSLINPTTQLSIYSPGNPGSTIDITNTWRSDVKQCNPTASASLEDTIQHQGYWLVILENGPGGDAYIRWTSDTSSSTEFIMYGTDPRWGTSPGYYNILRLNYITSTGTSNCDYYSNVWQGTNDGLISTSNASQLPIFLSTFPVSYPSGYAGLSIPYGPTYGPITGDIECFNNDTQINSVYVTPSAGISGYAVLGGSGSSRSYTYYPSESSSTYQLSIDCGGVTQGTSPTNIDPSVYQSPTWYCSTVVSSSCYPQ